MDRAELIIRESSISVAAMVDADWTDIELVPLRASGPVTEAEIADLRQRGMSYLGVVGIAPSGQLMTALGWDLDGQRRAAVVAAFSAYCDFLLEADRRQVDFVTFANGLMSLADTRSAL